MKCVDCKNCIGFVEGFYICYLVDSFEMVEECIANDENMGCDGFVQDRDDDFTA